MTTIELAKSLVQREQERLQSAAEHEMLQHLQERELLQGNLPESIDQLIDSCRDHELRSQLEIVSEPLSVAEAALAEALSLKDAAVGRVPLAERQLAEAIGTIAGQFGSDGGRYELIRNGDFISMEPKGPNGVDQDNVREHSSRLWGYCRVISDARSDFGITAAREEVSDCVRDVDAVKQAMAHSEY